MRQMIVHNALSSSSSAISDKVYSYDRQNRSSIVKSIRRISNASHIRCEHWRDIFLTEGYDERNEDWFSGWWRVIRMYSPGDPALSSLEKGCFFALAAFSYWNIHEKVNIILLLKIRSFAFSVQISEVRNLSSGHHDQRYNHRVYLEPFEGIWMRATANGPNVIWLNASVTSLAGPKPDASLMICIRPPVLPGTKTSMFAYFLLMINTHRRLFSPINAWL